MESVIDRFFEILPASDVLFRRLHGRVTEKKLNLLEFASCAMAEAGTGTTEIMRREMVNADPFGILLNCGPNNIGSDSKTQFSPVFPDPPEYEAFSDSGSANPAIDPQSTALRPKRLTSSATEYIIADHFVGKPESDCSVTCPISRFYGHLPRTLIDLNGSMSALA